MNLHLRWQRWLGLGLTAVMLPLALTGAVMPAMLLPAAVTAAALLFAQKPLRPLPNWVENLLAPVIVLLVLVTGGLRFGVMRPVAHLVVLLAAVRFWGGALPPRRRLSLLLLALLGVAGVASSTHPLLVPYLLAVLGGMVLAVGDLLPKSLANRWGVPVPQGGVPPKLVLATVALATAVAVPLFVLFPRLRSPFAAVAVGGTPVSGFREAVALHQLGQIKTSRRPMLRVRFLQAEQVNPSWLRFAGATLSHYRVGRWLEAKHSLKQKTIPEGLGVGEVAEVSLEQASDRLFVPPGTTGLLAPSGVEPWVDGAEAFRIPRQIEPPITFKVSFAPKEVFTSPPGDEDLLVSIDKSRLLQLALEATEGADTPLEKAKALETFLQKRYKYTTTSNTPLRADPVEWFLWTSKAGHCEFFASSMVLLLRVLGIPARLQTGFAGGQQLGHGEYLLRDANAHAWVLAFVDERWQVFDPTPPEGQPGIDLSETFADIRALWGKVEAFWDRWILTFSLADQLQFFLNLLAVARRTFVWAVLVLAGLLLLRLVWLRPGRPVERRQKASPLGQVLQTVAKKAGWRAEELDLVPPSRVLASLLPKLQHAQAACLWLFRAHEQTLYGGGAAPSRREVARAVTSVLKDLQRHDSARDRTTNGPRASSPGEKGSLPKRPPRSGR